MNNRKLLSVLLAFVLLLTGALPAVTASAKVYSLGDVNGDGKITSADARMILRVAAKVESFSEAQEKAADVNRSGKVNSGDARTTLRVAAKIETLTVGENEVFDDGRRESALDPANEKAVPAFIETMNSGRFLLRGTMTDNTEGETIPITFAKSGEDIRMSAELSGIALDMAQIDGTIYLISSGKKSYIEMTESIMNTLGLDPDDLDLDFGEIDEGGDPDWTQREYDGRTVECCIITTEEGIFEFYVESGTVLMLRMLDPSGVCTTEIDVEEFRGGVTAEDIAIPADYEQKSLVSFIADILGDTEYEPEPYDFGYFSLGDPYVEADHEGEPAGGEVLERFFERMRGDNYMIWDSFQSYDLPGEANVVYAVCGDSRYFAPQSFGTVPGGIYCKGDKMYLFDGYNERYAPMSKTQFGALNRITAYDIEMLMQPETLLPLDSSCDLSKMTWGKKNFDGRVEGEPWDCWTETLPDGRLRDYFVAGKEKVVGVVTYDPDGLAESVHHILLFNDDVAEEELAFCLDFQQTIFEAIIATPWFLQTAFGGGAGLLP